MSTAASKVQGVTIGYGAGTTPESYTNIGEIQGFSGLEFSKPTVDVSDLDSTVARKISSGLKAVGPLTIDLLAAPSGTAQTAIRTDMDAATLRAFKITLSDSGNTTLTFNGYYASYTPCEGRKGEAAGGRVVIDVDGDVTVTA